MAVPQKLALERAGLEPSDVGMLSAATGQGDYVLPGFGSQVQAGLEIRVPSSRRRMGSVRVR